MDELLLILKKHHELYPLMQFEDVYKLIYQHCFGPKHLFSSEKDIYESIKNESECCKNDTIQFIDIGNGYVRASITKNDEINKGISSAFLNTINSDNKVLDIEHILIELKIEICKIFNINNDVFDRKISILKEKNYPPISHSEIYKKNYSPHYRVILKEFIQ